MRRGGAGLVPRSVEPSHMRHSFGRTLKRFPLISLVVLAAGLVPNVGHAAGSILDAATGSGNRWVSYAFTNDGSFVNFDISAKRVSRGGTIALYFYDDDDALLGGASWSTVGWKSGASVVVPAGGIEVGVVESPSPDGEMRIILNDPSSPLTLLGRFKVLLFVAGDAESWSYKVEGSGVTDLVKDVGNRTFFYLSDDFEATASARAHARIPTTPETAPWVGAVSNLGARATVEGHLSLDVEDTLIANFGSVAFAPHQTFSVDSPGGPIDCGFYGCGFNRFEGSRHCGPGTYTFNTTGVNAGLSAWAELVLTGADARLPD